MFLRLTFNACGTSFNAQESIDQLNVNKKSIIYDKEFPTSLSIKHPREFSSEYYDEEYERFFLDFIKNNIDILVSYGANDFDLFIEAYYNDQCNFEILSPQFLYYLNKYQIRLPISVYYNPI